MNTISFKCPKCSHPNAMSSVFAEKGITCFGCEEKFKVLKGKDGEWYMKK